MFNPSPVIKAITLVLLFCLPLHASEETQKVTLRVDGLACPFCAYGLEKKIKKIEGMEKLDIKINEGLVNLFYKKGAEIDKELIAKKVKEAGFTPKEITIIGEETKTKQAQKITLNIKGMSCEGCVERIGKTLGQLDCVRDVKVSLADNKAEFTCTKEKFEPANFITAIEDLGFQAQLEDGVK